MNRTKGILIVDDEYQQRQSIKLTLEYNGFTNVHLADGGIECINKLNGLKDDIHIVLLDLVMPEKDGYEVFDYITQIHPYNVGVIIISAHLAENIKQLNKEESTEIISKPIHSASLISKIDSILEIILGKRTKVTNEYLNTINENYTKVHQDLNMISYKINMLEESLNQLKNISNSNLDKMNNRLLEFKKSDGSLSTFLKDLGKELLKIIIIGLAVIVMLKCDIVEIIKNIIK